MITELPTLPCGRVSWLQLCADKQAGDTIVLPLRYRHLAPTQLARAVHRISSHATNSTVVITFQGRRDEPAPEVPTPAPKSAPHHPIYELGLLLNKIEHTKSRIAHFRIQQNECSLHSARVEAGARVLLYESQLRTLRAKLAELQSA